MIPLGLRRWFTVHFLVDVVFALPLIFTPAWLLSSLNFPPENLLFARLIGSALLAIGGTSFIIRYSESVDVYKVMLALKLIWSGSAILAIVLSVNQQAPISLFAVLFIFIAFFVIWASYFKKINTK